MKKLSLFFAAVLVACIVVTPQLWLDPACFYDPAVCWPEIPDPPDPEEPNPSDPDDDSSWGDCGDSDQCPDEVDQR